MATVLLTGGRGASGRWIADRLATDHDVVVVDYDHPGLDREPAPGLSFRAADLADRGEALDVVAAVDPDVVVHWAAIPVAGTHPDAPIVQASSDGAYGFFFAEPTPMPDEVPVTESHPLRPEDPYGLSKVTAEQTAAAVARRHDVSAVSLRPSWIQYPGAYACRAPAYTDDLDAGAGNFWSYVDVRDVAALVARAVDALRTDRPPIPPGTHEAVNCVAADNALGRPLLELLRAVYDEVPEATAVSDDDDRSAYAIERAADRFGWEPQHSWRTAAAATVEEPTLFE
jgi:nucleoside-diphosphate-sugar epimerase